MTPEDKRGFVRSMAGLCIALLAVAGFLLAARAIGGGIVATGEYASMMGGQP